MTSIFLSYDHEDTALAAPIAAALEEAGHSVWWDRHIHGGAEFNSEIEAAVERADVVVVLWSERSVRSAWVRDEAAEGRDARKLVPVALDHAKPPMGFRQYQTIALPPWRGRTPPQLTELLHAIEKVARPVAGVRTPITAWAGAPQRRVIPITFLGVAAVLIALVVGGLLVLNPFASRTSAAVVAVTPGNSTSGSQNYAKDLLTQLGQLQSAKPDMLELVGANAGQRARFVLEVAGSGAGHEARVNLMLLDGKTGGLLWSKIFERPAAEVADLRQELGFTAAQVLECAVDAHAGGRAALRPRPLKTYLNGCAELASGSASMIDLIPLFRGVISAAPNFEGAWSKLLLAEDQTYEDARYGDAQARWAQALRRDIAAARRVNPEIAEAYLAEADLLPYGAFGQKLSLIERAIASRSDSPAARSFLSGTLFAVGRVSDALDEARRASDLNPVSSRARNNYIFALAQSGRTQAALDEIAKAEELWPGSSAIAGARFAVNLRFGDPRIAWQMIESGQIGGGWIGARNFIKARISRSPDDIDRAVREARANYAADHGSFQHFVQTLSILDRENKLLELLLTVPLEDAAFVTDVTFRPAARELWRNPRSMAYAKRVGLLGYWQSSGKWPDFCLEPDLPYDCKKEAAKLK